MKKAMLTGLSMSLSLSALANCQSDFRVLQNKQFVALKPLKRTAIFSRADIKKLAPAEVKVVQDYLRYMQETIGEVELQVATEQYSVKNTNQRIGLKISVTDGGDESNMRYYLKNAGNDYKVLYRILDNQSPDYTWVCER